MPAVDDKHLFESLCGVLDRHGFETAAPPQASGLYLRLRPGAGVVVGWRPGQELLAPALQAHADGREFAARTEFRGLRGALSLSLTAILEQAGFAFTDHGGDLLVTDGPAPALLLAVGGAARVPGPRT